MTYVFDPVPQPAMPIEGSDKLGAGAARAEGDALREVEGDVTPICDVDPKLRSPLVVEEPRGAAILPPEPERCACAAGRSIPTTMIDAATAGQI